MYANHPSIRQGKNSKANKIEKVCKSRWYFKMIYGVYLPEYYVTVKIIFIKTINLFGKNLIMLNDKSGNMLNVICKMSNNLRV